MFISNLYREPHGLQDTIEVLVLDKSDEQFLLQHRIQIDLHDDIFKVRAVARLPSGREVEVDKRSSIKQLYSDVVREARKFVLN